MKRGYGLDEETAKWLCEDKKRADYFEECVKIAEKEKDDKITKKSLRS